MDTVLKQKLTDIVNDHVDNWVKKKVKEELLNDSFVTRWLDTDMRVMSTISRSLDSSSGTLYERILEELSHTYNDTTTTVLDTVKKEKGKKNSKYIMDLAFSRDGKHYIIEVKLHCELDNKKSKSEMKALKAFRKAYIKEKKITNSENVKIYIASVGNKDGHNPTDFKMGRLTSAFTREEVLVERELFDLVTGQPDFFDQFVTFNRDVICPKINTAVKEIIKANAT